jgi:small subunit ribosomal protein S20
MGYKAILKIFLTKQNKMANHKSAQKRIRSNEAKKLRNKYQHKTTRNAVRRLRAVTDKKEAETLFPSVAAMLDKLAKRNVIHKNKAANLKSGLQVALNKL